MDQITSLLHYRINRLYDLLSFGSIFDAIKAGTSFLLQLYIDAHLPLAHAIECGKTPIESNFKPFMCFEELLSAHVSDVTEAFAQTIPNDVARRTNKRSRSLWEVFRHVLLRGVHESVDGKPKTFKTISADFNEVLQHNEGVCISEIVMCSLLGNYKSSKERPSWSARLLLYEKYTSGTTSWLSKCDYLLYYSICECMHALCARVPSLVQAIESHHNIDTQWSATHTMTQTIIERLRASLRDCPSVLCMNDLNDMMKNRHIRMTKSIEVSQSTSPHPKKVSTFLIRESMRRRIHGPWKSTRCSEIMHAMLTMNLSIRLQEIADTFLSTEVCQLLETTTNDCNDKFCDHIFKQCQVRFNKGIPPAQCSL